MNPPKSRLTVMLVLIAGAILCLPQVAGASTAFGRHAAMASRRGATSVVRHVTHRTTTTVAKRTTTTTVVKRTTTTTAPTNTATTTVPVVLIPPIVVFPPVVTTHPKPRVLATAVVKADPPQAIVPLASADPVGQLLPATGSSHLGLITLCGLLLIALGLIIRRGPEAG